MSAQLDFYQNEELALNEILLINKGLDDECLVFPDGTVLDFSDD